MGRRCGPISCKDKSARRGHVEPRFKATADCRIHDYGAQERCKIFILPLSCWEVSVERNRAGGHFWCWRMHQAAVSGLFDRGAEGRVYRWTITARWILSHGDHKRWLHTRDDQTIEHDDRCRTEGRRIHSDGDAKSTLHGLADDRGKLHSP